VGLQYEAPSGHLHVRWVRAETIAVADRELDRSFLLAPDQIIEAWPAVAVDDLDAEALSAVHALEPELVLLGTGGRQVFPPPAVMAAFLSRGIGIEVMDNAAAARTFNLLASEGRRVVAAFMLG
jgi:uncharacterized protein